jgi:hypothetical protein
MRCTHPIRGKRCRSCGARSGAHRQRSTVRCARRRARALRDHRRGAQRSPTARGGRAAAERTARCAARRIDPRTRSPHVAQRALSRAARSRAARPQRRASAIADSMIEQVTGQSSPPKRCVSYFPDHRATRPEPKGVTAGGPTNMGIVCSWSARVLARAGYRRADAGRVGVGYIIRQVRPSDCFKVDVWVRHRPIDFDGSGLGTSETFNLM